MFGPVLLASSSSSSSAASSTSCTTISSASNPLSPPVARLESSLSPLLSPATPSPVFLTSGSASLTAGPVRCSLLFVCVAWVCVPSLCPVIVCKSYSRSLPSWSRDRLDEEGPRIESAARWTVRLLTPRRIRRIAACVAHKQIIRTQGSKVY